MRHIPSSPYRLIVAPQHAQPQKAIMAELAADMKSGSVLIICPRYATLHWYQLANQFGLNGGVVLRVLAFEDVRGTNITSPTLCIIDQVQHTGTPRSPISTRAFAFARRAKYVTLITSKLPDDAWAVWPILKLFGATITSFSSFTSTYCKKHVVDARTIHVYGWDESNAASLRTQLTRYIRTILPSPIAEIVEYRMPYNTNGGLPLTGRQLARKLKASAARVDITPHMMEEYQPLFDLCAHERLDATVAFIKDYLSDEVSKLVVISANGAYRKALHTQLATKLPDHKGLVTLKLPLGRSSREWVQSRNFEGYCALFTDPHVIPSINTEALTDIFSNVPLTFVATSDMGLPS